MDTTQELINRLLSSGVEFVLVGGMAGIVHGSSVVTEDLDICAPLSEENLKKLLTALSSLHPRWRMRPNLPPLTNDPIELTGFKNLYLLTDAGQLDVLRRGFITC